MAVECGRSHFLTLDDDGFVWGFGAHSCGQLGIHRAYIHKRLNSTLTKGIKLPLKNISAISCSLDHSVCSDLSGDVFVFGNNSRGQLGVYGLYPRTNPERIRKLRDIISVHTGDAHTLCIDSNNDIYGFGCNGSGQLGLGTEEPFSLPVKLPAMSNIKTASCGRDFSIIVNFDGETYSCGANNRGELGISLDSETFAASPVLVPGLPSVISVTCGYMHTLALSGDGKVFAFGFNGKGQLGLGQDPVLMSSPPALIENLMDIASIHCGDRHSIAIDRDGSVWVCGNNEDGQLGLPSITTVYSFIKLEQIEGVEIASCGSEFTVLKNSEGTWRFGRFCEEDNSPALLPHNVSKKIGLQRTNQTRTVKSARK